MSIADLIEAARAPLSAADTITLFDAILAGRVEESELITYLSATADRKPTVDELVGAVTSMRKHMHTVPAPTGAIDLCGTGGDGLGTLNISTAVSFVVAALGVPVAKHGNRSASSRSGAADTLEAMGVRLDQNPDAVSRILRDAGMAFLFAQTHHPAMRHAAAARRQIGRRTIFNLLGPLANPAGVTRQLVGVFSTDWLTPYAQALNILGSKKAWIVHGNDGLDEISISGPSQIVVLKDGAISQMEITPEDAGLQRQPLRELLGGDAHHNADALRRLFEGNGFAAYHAVVVLNSAAALIVANKAADLREGANMADAAIRDGRARAMFDKFLTTSNE
jgi:anthranilate phosphoribosyltransferase